MKAQQPIRLHQHAAYSLQSIGAEGCSMELVIPDGAQVHIMVGQPPLVALPNDPRAVASQPERPSGRIVKSLVVGVLLIGAFQTGRLLPHHAETASAAQPTAAAGTVPDVTGRSAAGEIPPAFRAQIAQPPHVVPPPGATPAAATAGAAGGVAAPVAAPAPANPFGLQG
jgi:hypothetical protein